MFGNKEKKEKPDKEAFKIALSQDNFRQIQKLFSEYQSMTGEPLTAGVEVCLFFPISISVYFIQISLCYV